MIRFVVFLLIVMVVIGFAAYESALYWLPGIRDSKGVVNIEAFKAIAAAIATAVAALIAAGASILNVGLQLRAGKSLEETKRRLAGELEADKIRYMKELEVHKNQLSAQKSEIERKLALLEQTQDIASNYRSVIGLLRQGQYEKEEIEGLQRKVEDVRNRLDPEDELSGLWAIFAQNGYYLNELAGSVKAVRARRDIWKSATDAGIARGVEFATSADAVLAKIRDQRLAIVEAATRTEP
jgi:hypothetical protein